MSCGFSIEIGESINPSATTLKFLSTRTPSNYLTYKFRSKAAMFPNGQSAPLKLWRKEAVFSIVGAPTPPPIQVLPSETTCSHPPYQLRSKSHLWVLCQIIDCFDKMYSLSSGNDVITNRADMYLTLVSMLSSPPHLIVHIL